MLRAGEPRGMQQFAPPLVVECLLFPPPQLLARFWLIGRTSGRAAFLLGFDYRIGVRLAEEEKNHGIPRYTLLLELNDLAPR